MLRSSRPVLGLLLAITLAGSLALVSPGAQAAPTGSHGTDPSPRALLHRAQRALDRVEQIFSSTGTTVRGDATMALRNLAETKSALPPSQQREAERYFARPTASGSNCPGDYACYKSTAQRFERCNSRICVHYVKQGSGTRRDNTNGVDPEDDGKSGRWPGRAHNGVPDMVEFTLKSLSHIDAVYRKAGYRSTLGDGHQGGDSRRDIYLGNIGSKGVYGYCTSDDPKLAYDAAGTKHPAVSAYCVLDNDYSRSEFPYHSPRQNLAVTAAHEYFHAVQFAYDFDEDAWMMEATATWAEDELYTKINDNRQYLPLGPMGKPWVNLDAYSNSSGNSGYLHQYGTWIFFRYLTERYPTKQGILPTLVRRIWNLSVGKSGYSVAAIKQALAERGTSLDTELARFVVANRRPALNYSEGRAYTPAPLGAKPETLSTALLAPRSNRRAPALPHLAAATYQYVPGTGVTQLDIHVTSAATADVEAAVVVHRTDGSYRRTIFRANGTDDSVAFDPATVAWVEVSLINAGTRFSCWDRTSYAWMYTCQGHSEDNNSGAAMVVTAS
ncbi:MAG TPA: MXAN_6640 family putative metalloprotease [Nocardioides sp.]|nr:MXAN_6640 family putative metalloprotease [Nocardioides sp.]